jgi:hypothetical protein
MDPNQVNPQQPAQGQTNQLPPAPTAGVVEQAPGPKPLVKGVKGPASNPNSTQNLLQIAEIRDGIVIMQDGSFRSVVMVKPINFDLMSMQEKQSVEYAYQRFLNSLYFPIQIFIHSEKVDLTPYLEKLDKIRSEQDNMLLALMMDDYIQYMATLSQQTNIMDKRFYIVIPYFPVVNVQQSLTQSKNFFTGLGELFSTKQKHVTINEANLQAAKDELKNRVQSLISGLQQSNIPSLPLDTQELIELYYNTYNPDTATHQPLHDFNDLTAPIVEKGEGFAVQPNLERETPS